MSAIAAQTAGPNGVKCFEETHVYSKVNIGLKKFYFFAQKLDFLKFDFFYFHW